MHQETKQQTMNHVSKCFKVFHNQKQENVHSVNLCDFVVKTNSIPEKSNVIVETYQL